MAPSNDSAKSNSPSTSPRPMASSSRSAITNGNVDAPGSGPQAHPQPVAESINTTLFKERKKVSEKYENAMFDMLKSFQGEPSLPLAIANDIQQVVATKRVEDPAIETYLHNRIKGILRGYGQLRGDKVALRADLRAEQNKNARLNELREQMEHELAQAEKANTTLHNRIASHDHTVQGLKNHVNHKDRELKDLKTDSANRHTKLKDDTGRSLKLLKSNIVNKDVEISQLRNKLRDEVAKFEEYEQLEAAYHDLQQKYLDKDMRLKEKEADYKALLRGVGDQEQKLSNAHEEIHALRVRIDDLIAAATRATQHMQAGFTDLANRAFGYSTDMQAAFASSANLPTGFHAEEAQQGVGYDFDDDDDLAAAGEVYQSIENVGNFPATLNVCSPSLSVLPTQSSDDDMDTSSSSHSTATTPASQTPPMTMSMSPVSGTSTPFNRAARAAANTITKDMMRLVGAHLCPPTNRVQIPQGSKKHGRPDDERSPEPPTKRTKVKNGEQGKHGQILKDDTGRPDPTELLEEKYLSYPAEAYSTFKCRITRKDKTFYDRGSDILSQGMLNLVKKQMGYWWKVDDKEGQRNSTWVERANDNKLCAGVLSTCRTKPVLSKAYGANVACKTCTNCSRVCIRVIKNEIFLLSTDLKLRTNEGDDENINYGFEDTEFWITPRRHLHVDQDYFKEC